MRRDGTGIYATSRHDSQSKAVNEQTFQFRTGHRDWTRHRGLIALGILGIGASALLGWATAWRGATGVRWAILAISICGVAGLLSLIASKFVRGQQAALWTMLVGMGIRMTAALTGCLIVNSLWRDGIDAGFGWYLVVAYLVTLAVDILYLVNPNPQTSSDRYSVGPISSPLVVPSTPGERHG
jgi:hypothetical protein